MKLKEAAISSLQQMSVLIAKLNDESYSKSLLVLHNASIGQHVRHILDFYSCVLAYKNSGDVNYDARERDKRIEENGLYARIVAENMIKDLQALELSDKVNVIQNFSVDKTNTTEIIKSTIGRELMYAFDHTVHHMAIIKIGLKNDFPEIETDRNLGVAPSTVRNRN